jgi:queuine tRNA-ribosyltransferase
MGLVYGAGMTAIALPPFTYQLEAESANARAGRFHTPHGVIETPVFMPVGTHSAVRTLTRDQVLSTQAQIILSNAYHLYLRPGHEQIDRAGGIHEWMNWPKPVLTDSGGFQVFSLAKFRKITPEGVHFRDTLSGDKHFIGPKESMAIQNGIGADIIMAFDECPPYPATYDYARKSLDITHRWLTACFEHHQKPNQQALFPIVQGSTFPDLRAESAAFVQQFPAHGFAIGGVSVGESKEWVNKVVEETAPQLPKDKPRYLMGVGTPEDLLDGIRNGIDMFDCVMPTRIARHGSFFSSTGRKIIKNACFTEDYGPLDEGCDCYACQHHTAAYIRHLYRQGEATASSLLSMHNIRFLVRLGEEARQAILAHRFEDFYAERIGRLVATAV